MEKKIARSFFGRDAEIEELYDRVFETDLVLLYGASGTGKTSLIRCGLANQFASTEWLPIWIRRDNNINESWLEAIRTHAVKEIAEGGALHKQVRSLYLDYFKPIYFIFDQFEEIFISGSKAEQTTFFEDLHALLEAGVTCKIILSMREEWIAYLSDYELIIPSLFDNRQRIERMNRGGLQEVIMGTAQAYAIEMPDEEDTANRIIDHLQQPNQTVELAILQIYLDKLYRNDLKRRGDENRPVRFDTELISQTKQLEDVLSDFLIEQMNLVEQELQTRGIEQKGVPMDILFSLVTEDGTKKISHDRTVRDLLFKRKKNIPGNH